MSMPTEDFLSDVANSKEWDEQRKLFSAALAKAVLAVRNAAKDSKNAFHKYAYTSTEGMIVACREALSDNGITLTRCKSSVTMTTDPAMLMCRFIVRHSGGYTELIEIQWPVIPEKGRPFDKALAASLTSSLGYVLRDLLLVPRQDEDEHMDKRDDRTHDPNVIGELGAEKIRQRLDGWNIPAEALVSAIERSGHKLHGDMAMWPKSLMGRIDKWITAKAEDAAAELEERRAIAEADVGQLPEGDEPQPQQDEEPLFETTPAERAKSAISKGRSKT